MDTLASKDNEAIKETLETEETLASKNTLVIEKLKSFLRYSYFVC
jgi:hypothetical protein